MKFSSLIILTCITISLCLSCTDIKKQSESNSLSETDKELITNFASDLTKSLSSYHYDLIKSSWDKTAFRKRVGDLSRTERTMYKVLFEEAVVDPMMTQNLELINKLKHSDGLVFLTKMAFLPGNPGCTELTFSMIFDEFVDFVKFRVEIINNTPRLTDLYSYRDELWQSKNVKNIIRLNSKYTASTEARQRANQSLMLSDRALMQKDTLLALEYLYQVPETHLMGNSLSIRRISLALQMDQEVLASVLTSEMELNNSLYIRYLYGYYFYDSVLLEQVFKELELNIGKNSILDSLATLDYLWY
jgi:hypothetical protein